VRARWVIIGLVLAGSACVDGALSPPGTADLDGDGHLAADDCDDRDPFVFWRQQAFRDADGDGHGAGPLETVCTTGPGFPAGWSPVSDDCDDANPGGWDAMTGYVDEDGDRYGVGPAIDVCAAGTLPVGFALIDGDCDPSDPARWRIQAYLYRDADGDGVTVAREGVVCSGTMMDPGYPPAPSGVDCDDGDPHRWLTMEGYPDTDGDGAGAGSRVSLCTGGQLPPGYVTSADDCARDDSSAWRVFSYTHRDVDGDGWTVASGGTLCVGASVPVGYLTAARGSDCDDGNREAWQVLTGYADDDRDQVGAGALLSFCAGATLPAGHVATGGDCDATDGEAWRFWSYTHRDADGDGWTVPLAGTLCIGTTPPAGYATAASGNDCDDVDADVWATVYGYADVDDDGVGAGAPLTSCTDGSLAPGQVALSGDCASNDRTAWRLLSHAWADRDGDGYTVPDAGQVCAGESLPEPYRVAAVGRDCDDAAPSVFSALVRYPDLDGDGVGAPPRAVFCVGASVESAGHSRYGWDVDDADPSVQWDDEADDLLLLVL
jgi:hypothetical protein